MSQSIFPHAMGNSQVACGCHPDYLLRVPSGRKYMGLDVTKTLGSGMKRQSIEALRKNCICANHYVICTRLYVDRECSGIIDRIRRELSRYAAEYHVASVKRVAVRSQQPPRKRRVGLSLLCALRYGMASCNQRGGKHHSGSAARQPRPAFVVQRN